jgi:hypothetical protein
MMFTFLLEDRQGVRASALAPSKLTMRSKYKNKKRIIDGQAFDSGNEAKMYQTLRLLERGGAIHSLETQVRFELQPKFENVRGEKVRAIGYIADFTFYDNEQGRERVIDCKGFKTAVYKLKKKMFDYRYSKQGLILEETI